MTKETRKRDLDDQTTIYIDHKYRQTTATLDFF